MRLPAPVNRRSLSPYFACWAAHATDLLPTMLAPAVRTHMLPRVYCLQLIADQRHAILTNMARSNPDIHFSVLDYLANCE